MNVPKEILIRGIDIAENHNNVLKKLDAQRTELERLVYPAREAFKNEIPHIAYSYESFVNTTKYTEDSKTRALKLLNHLNNLDNKLHETLQNKEEVK